MEWCDEKIALLINFSSQSIFLFGVKLSDYHNRMKRAASRSSTIINFDVINWRQADAICTKDNIWRRFAERVYEASVVSESCVSMTLLLIIAT